MQNNSNAMTNRTKDSQTHRESHWKQWRTKIWWLFRQLLLLGTRNSIHLLFFFFSFSLNTTQKKRHTRTIMPLWMTSSSKLWSYVDLISSYTLRLKTRLKIVVHIFRHFFSWNWTKYWMRLVLFEWQNSWIEAHHVF